MGNQTTKRHYLGCFPCDRLPIEIPRHPCSLIANNDPASKDGSHWVAMFIIDTDHVYYFDSLGCEPNSCIRNFLKRFKFVTRNQKIIQSFDSNACGLYCIYFVYCMSIYKNKYLSRYEKLLENLSKVNNPDNYVYNFVNKFL